MEETLDAIRSGTARPQLTRKHSVSLLSHDQVRAKVVMEILSSERAFVQDVGNVIEVSLGGGRADGLGYWGRDVQCHSCVLYWRLNNEHGP